MLRLRAFETKSGTPTIQATAAPAEAWTLNANPTHFPVVEAYVAKLRAGLQGAGSEKSTLETCEEVRQHLLASVLARLDLGEDVEAAETEAVRRFGGVAKHRMALRHEMHRMACRTNPKVACRFALALYGGFCTFDVFGALFFTIAPQVEGYRYLLDYWQWYVIFWLLVGSPLIAGCIVGRQTGSLSFRATCRAQALIVGGLLMASVLAYLIDPVVSGFSSAREIDTSQHWPVYLTFGLACYYVIRFPVSLLAASLLGRTRRHSSRLMKG